MILHWKHSVLFPSQKKCSCACFQEVGRQALQPAGRLCGNSLNIACSVAALLPLVMETLQFCKIQQHQSEVPPSSIPAGSPSKGALQPRVKHYWHSRDMHLSAFVSVNLPISTGANLAGKFSFKYPGNTACTQQNNYFKQDAISFSCRIFMLPRCFINNRGKIVNKKGLGFS